MTEELNALRTLAGLVDDDPVCDLCVWAVGEIERLRACHDAELGVCFKYCDEVAALRDTADALRASMHRIVAMAGHPDAAEGCRLIIAEATKEQPNDNVE